MPEDDLRWFLTLAEAERVTLAAERLHLTQPTLSRMLARLERRLAAPLFDRVGKRIELNAFGRIYYEHARRAQAELDAAQRSIADLRNPALGTVRLAFLHSFGPWLVPQLIAGFRRRAGNVACVLSEDAADRVTEQVLTGRADLALVSPRPTHAGLGWRQLLRQPVALAVPEHHPHAGRRQIRLSDVAEEPFVTLGPGHGMRRVFDELCAAAQIHPRIALESSQLTTVAGLIAAGLGVGVLPVEQYAGIVPVPLADPGAFRDVGLIWAADTAPSTAARLFRDYVVEWATAQR